MFPPLGRRHFVHRVQRRDWRRRNLPTRRRAMAALALRKIGATMIRESLTRTDRAAAQATASTGWLFREARDRSGAEPSRPAGPVLRAHHIMPALPEGIPRMSPGHRAPMESRARPVCNRLRATFSIGQEGRFNGDRPDASWPRWPAAVRRHDDNERLVKRRAIKSASSARRESSEKSIPQTTAPSSD